LDLKEKFEWKTGTAKSWCCNKDYMSCFGNGSCDLVIMTNADTCVNYATAGSSFDWKGKKVSDVVGDLQNTNKFKLDEIEVFQLC